MNAASPTSLRRRLRRAPAIGALLVVGLAVATLAGCADDAPTLDVGSDDSGSTSGDPTGAPVFGEVTVDGAPLVTLESSAADPAVGQAVPTVTSTAGGTTVTIDAAAGEPMVLAFLAHWCPHCQRELPVLVELAEAGAFDGVRTVAVLTGTNENAPNFPPAAWLDDEGWTGERFYDDGDSTAASAFGLTGYPLLVFVAADGTVVARTAGELPAADIEQLVDVIRG